MRKNDDSHSSDENEAEIEGLDKNSKILYKLLSAKICIELSSIIIKLRSY